MGLSRYYGKLLLYFNLFIKYKCNYSLMFIVVYLSKEKADMTDLCSAIVTKELSVLSVCFAWVTGRTGSGCLIFKIRKKNKPCFKNSFDKECNIKQNIVTSDGQKLKTKINNKEREIYKLSLALTLDYELANADSKPPACCENPARFLAA